MSSIKAIADNSSPTRKLLLQAHLERLAGNENNRNATVSQEPETPQMAESPGKTKAIVTARAVALHIQPSAISSVHMTGLGNVDVRGNMDFPQEWRLEAALQCDQEFQQLYRSIREQEQTASKMQSYA